jgi:hypothetical protein
MRKSDAFPSRFYKATDLEKPVELEIAFVVAEDLENLEGKIENKPVVTFTTGRKQLVLNNTNWDAIVQLTGQPDSDHWAGGRIELFQDMTRMGTNVVPCVRVRAPKSTKSVKDDLEDEITF